MKLQRFLALLGAAVFLCTPAGAGVITYEFGLSGLEEVPPNASPATGFAVVMLDPDTNTLSWNITYEGLLGTQTAAHFHGPAPVGVNAGIQVNIGVGNPLIGNAVITDTQEQMILDGLTYVNIHSTVFPGGEIRGQVVPEPTTLALLGLAGVMLIGRRR